MPRCSWWAGTIVPIGSRWRGGNGRSTSTSRGRFDRQVRRTGLLAGGGGAIVCVGSPAGQFGLAPGLDAYSASKAGVVGLVRVAAMDYATHGIRVNGVFPGITETPMNHWWMDDPAARERTAATIPIGRPAHPVEIANVVAFLASDE